MRASICLWLGLNIDFNAFIRHHIYPKLPGGTNLRIFESPTKDFRFDDSFDRSFFASNFEEVNRPYEVSVRRKTRVELRYPITGELLILTVHKNHQSLTSEKQHIGKTSPCRKRARPKGRGGRTPSPLRMANSIKLDGVRKFATNYSAEKE